MSSASERYQSKLFNFLQRQTRNFGEGFGRTLRKLQVNTNWSLEALLYPVYLLIQKSQEIAGKQLPSSNNADLTHTLTADTPIMEVLEIAEKLQVETVRINQLAEVRSQVERHGDTPTHPISSGDAPGTTRGWHYPPIVGIASQISNQGLVLVTAENNILDILTPYQQVILEEKIIGEIAKYWQAWRKIGVKNRTNLPLRLKGSGGRLTGRKPSSEEVLPSGVAAEDVYKMRNPERSLSRIDAMVAKWETSAIVPISTTGEIIRVVRTQIQVFFYGTQDADRIVAADDLSPQKKFPALIQAAWDYFFGDRHQNKLEQSVSTTQLTEAFPPALKSPESAAWLTPDDLFANSPPGKPFAQQLISSSPSIQTAPQTKRGLRFWRWQQDDHLATTQNESAKVATDNNNKIIPEQPTSSEMEAQPDWIETSARTIGYEKHPLEKVLLWLDNMMLRIEAILAKLFHYLQAFRTKN